MCVSLLLFMIVNEESLGFGLLVGQNEKAASLTGVFLFTEPFLANLLFTRLLLVLYGIGCHQRFNPTELGF